MTSYIRWLLAATLVLSLSSARSQALHPAATLIPMSDAPCLADCGSSDALIFVHGIYGDAATFRNAKTGFDWPSALPISLEKIEGLQVDVYRLDYESALIAWARQRNPDFVSVADAVSMELAPLRRRGYRSIGFIAHSLGGNIVSTYLHEIKSRYGHAARSQHAYVITLGTPVLGSDVASIALPLKRLLRINDDLLNSLQKGDLFLRMLNRFREMERRKSAELGCRPVNLHAAYEEKRVAGLVQVVDRESAALSIANLASSPVVGFRRDHFAIAKPPNTEDVVYVWVLDQLVRELIRVREWEATRRDAAADEKLCQGMRLLPER
jgi:hypothetical protein